MFGGRDRLGRTSLLLLLLTGLFLLTGITSALTLRVFQRDPTSLPTLLLVGAGPLSILAVAVVVLAFSRPEGVEEVFLVHDSGLLLVHFSKTVRSEKDRDIVVGMLTAVQGFIREAFSKTRTDDLRMMDFGDRRILIRKGSHSYLALLVRGRAPLGLSGRMKRSLERVEGTYRDAIEKWNGSADGITGADDLLLEGLLGDELRQIAVQIRMAMAKILRFLSSARMTATRKVPVARAMGPDPRASARKLLARPELAEFKPEYRDMMTTALQELADGHFTLAGLGNLYITMAMQKSPRSGAVGWWELMLRTVREALRTWPWDPEIQAWVMPEAENTADPKPTPASSPNNVVSFFSSPRSVASPFASRDAVPKPPVAAAAEHSADSA